MYRLTGLVSPEFSFRLGGEDLEAHRFSVVIGANGTGKSRLLAHLATGTMRPTDDRREEVGTPTPLVLAVSNLVIDSFPKPRAWNDTYRYLGLRQATNTVSTGSLDSSLGPYLVEMMASWGSTIDLRPVLNHVGVDRYDIVVAKRVRPVGEAGTYERLASSLANFGLEPPKQVIEALDAELSDVARNLNVARSLGTGEVLGHRLASLATYFDLHPAILLVSLRRAYGLTLDVRFDGRLEAKHPGLSAGQAMLLSMMVRIAAAIRPGSLVLVDEPETGTHPDWQSSFIPMIKETLPREAASHFFIASHSPFIVSDANDVLRADGSQVFEEVTSDVRGMSVEGILYRIFGTRVIGNSAVDADLTRVVTWISRRGRGMQTPPDVIGAATRLENIASEDTPTVNAILAELAMGGERPAS